MAKTRTSFKKGEGGRPLGSKNKSYLDPSHWLMRADELVQGTADEDKKLVIVKWATELVMSKVPAIPSSPSESTANATAAQAVINQAIEDQKQKMVDQLNADNPAEANSD
jgi:hypothetical protein